MDQLSPLQVESVCKGPGTAASDKPWWGPTTHGLSTFWARYSSGHKIKNWSEAIMAFVRYAPSKVVSGQLMAG